MAGGKLEETGTKHWKSPNTFATNETGFTALPGGGHPLDGTFLSIGIEGLWWLARVNYETGIFCQTVRYNISNTLWMNINVKWGLSVRCVND